MVIDSREVRSSRPCLVVRASCSVSNLDRGESNDQSGLCVLQIVAANVCAQSREGLPDRTVLIGSHMDGVAAGPGINDNGSGAMTNLEMALSLSRLVARGSLTLTNRVRFCWWGAEEEGLVGSHWYVDHLSDFEVSQIAGEQNTRQFRMSFAVSHCAHPSIIRLMGRCRCLQST